MLSARTLSLSACALVACSGTAPSPATAPRQLDATRSAPLASALPPVVASNPTPPPDPKPATPPGPELTPLVLQPAPFSVLQYPALPPKLALASDCAQPAVQAATAPLKAAQTEGWAWPWAVQALLAHDSVFRLVANLDDADQQTLRDVALFQKQTRSQLELVARCRNVETCNALAQTLRGAIPGSQALPRCGNLGAEEAVFATLPPKDITLATLPALASCARLAVCSREQGDRASPNDGTACQSAPGRFPLKCAQAASCFDVATCAGSKASVFRLSAFEEASQQLEARSAWLEQAYPTVSDVGNGGLDAGRANIDFSVFDPSSKKLGSWATLSLEMQAGNFTPDAGYQDGVLSWAVAFIDVNGHAIFGRKERAIATAFATQNLPSAGRLIGEGPMVFDYDGDGVVELLLQSLITFHSLGPVSKASVWQLQAGKVAQYPGTSSLPSVAFQDVNGDGRPDLMLDASPHYIDDTGSMHSSFDPGSWRVALSLANGKFAEPSAFPR